MIYLSGPMSGLADYNYPVFNEVAKSLRDQGHVVVNSAEFEQDTSKVWSHYMRQDLRRLLDCHTIALLPGWDRSRGATLELFVATQLGMRVVHLLRIQEGRWIIT